MPAGPVQVLICVRATVAPVKDCLKRLVNFCQRDVENRHLPGRCHGACSGGIQAVRSVWLRPSDVRAVCDGVCGGVQCVARSETTDRSEARIGWIEARRNCGVSNFVVSRPGGRVGRLNQ